MNYSRLDIIKAAAKKVQDNDSTELDQIESEQYDFEEEQTLTIFED